jgi:hypothetical protein
MILQVLNEQVALAACSFKKLLAIKIITLLSRGLEQSGLITCEGEKSVIREMTDYAGGELCGLRQSESHPLQAAKVNQGVN